MLGCLDEYDVQKRFRPFEKLANKIEEVEGCINASLVLGNIDRVKKKEEELVLLRQEVKLMKEKQRQYW